MHGHHTQNNPLQNGLGWAGRVTQTRAASTCCLDLRDQHMRQRLFRSLSSMSGINGGGEVGRASRCWASGLDTKGLGNTETSNHQSCSIHPTKDSTSRAGTTGVVGTIITCVPQSCLGKLCHDVAR